METFTSKAGHRSVLPMPDKWQCHARLHQHKGKGHPPTHPWATTRAWLRGPKLCLGSKNWGQNWRGKSLMSDPALKLNDNGTMTVTPHFILMTILWDGYNPHFTTQSGGLKRVPLLQIVNKWKKQEANSYPSSRSQPITWEACKIISTWAHPGLIKWESLGHGAQAQVVLQGPQVMWSMSWEL